MKLSLSALHVLILEDHGFQRRLAIRLLGSLGVTHVHEGADGAEALELLERLEVVPDVILVNLDMPGMDGIEFITHVAQRKLAQGVAVVSALDPALINTVQTVARGHDLHFMGSIQKPLTATKLQDVLTSYEERLQATPECDEDPVDAAALHAALAAGRIQAWFQPQVELANGQVISVEVLARWPRADGSMVGLCQFVPMLELDGLANALTDSMLAQACKWKKHWDSLGLRMRMSVNMSSAVEHLQALVRKHGVDPTEVMLEITESSLMADGGLSVPARLRLKGFGLLPMPPATAAQADADSDSGRAAKAFSARPSPTFENAQGEGSLILLVDDHPTNRMVISRQLALAGYASESAIDGMQALAQWASGRFALLLTDIHMPGLDGYELTRRIRQSEAAQGLPRTPVVALTASALKGESQRCLDAGMDDYMAKPVSIALLATTLGRWLPHTAPFAATAATKIRAEDEAPVSAAASDLGVLQSLLGEDVASARAVLEDFMHSLAQDFAGLARAEEARDLGAVNRQAHRIKGRAGGGRTTALRIG